MSSEPLVCPKCAKPHSLDERFCTNCGMPLVYAGKTGAEDPITAAHAKARKIKRQYSQGELVKVGWGRNQAEAEMVQNMLLEEGIPTTLRRSAGFDVADFLAAGPRDILAPASGAEMARALLQETGAGPPDRGLGSAQASPTAQPLRLALALLLAAVVAAGLIWLLVRNVS